MAERKGHKAKKNETSFKAKNKAAEKWTKTETELFFNKAYESSKTAITLTDISNSFDLYTSVFDYLVKKYPVFESLKKEILKNIENNTYKGALNNRYNSTIAIFGLKNNHNWSDKKEESKQDTTEPPTLKKRKSDESK